MKDKFGREIDYLRVSVTDNCNLRCIYCMSEKENNFLRKVINTFQKTLDKFIHWVCNKFSVSSEEEFIMDFQIENDIYLDPEKQVEYEEEKDWNLEL